MYQVYQIMPNDTLEGIATKFNTTVIKLRGINGFDENYPLLPGDNLVVPKVENTNFYKYNVQKGDNLYSIAKKFQIDEEVLEMLNGLEKNEYIYPEQELLIPKEDVLVYITEDETLEDVAMKSGMKINDLISQNQKIYVVPGQIIIYKDDKNE